MPAAPGGTPREGLFLASGDPGGGWNFGCRVLGWEEGVSVSVLSAGLAALKPVGRLVGVLDGSNDAKGSGPNVRCIGKE